MSVLLVSYDLKGDDSDYHQLIQALESYGHGRYCHAQKSVWLLDTVKTTSMVCDHLMSCITSEDALLVTAVRKNWAAFEKKFVLEWLENPGRRWD